MGALAMLKKGIPRISDTIESIACLVPRSLLAQKICYLLSECFQQLPQGSELIDWPIVCTLMLAQR
jgi:hypothetical protein